ncbi:uncharacterized protein PAC_02588 [Phialocephala subalpina]|uniref:Uncharacterized protein n=1 Tax=Phialocephala subalpina TaxID=576137 RepID=A0A1L7WIW4_9HELO|nr:uncharacterized protein PAC_02588 [Phialocephala subalpina]
MGASRVLVLSKNTSLWQTTAISGIQRSVLPILNDRKTRTSDLSHGEHGSNDMENEKDDKEEEISTMYTQTQTVETYSSCELTHDDDKLVAMSGIAERYHEKLLEASQCQCLAGIWSGKHIIPSFMCGPSPRGDPSVHFRPKIYRAPSWSWASMQGGIVYDYNKAAIMPECLQTRLATLIDSSMKLTSSNPYG